MKTLYVNISGENLQSSDDFLVIGKPEDAIINKFYFELGKEILKGVTSSGISNIKKKDIVTEFKNHDEVAFTKLIDQWECIKSILLGENPTGTYIVELPFEYVGWLQNNSQSAYAEIAKSLYQRGSTIEISIDKIYINTIGIIINNIDSNDCKQFVVNDNVVTDDSAISLAIREHVKDIVFVPFEDWITSHSQNSNNKFCNLNYNTSLVELDSQYEVIDQNEFYEGVKAGLPLFNDDVLLVKNNKNGKYGYISIIGEEILPCIYREAMPFASGLAWVKKEESYGKWFVIDKNGEVQKYVAKGYDIEKCNGSHVELGDHSFYKQNGEYIGFNGLYGFHSLEDVFEDDGFFNKFRQQSLSDDYTQFKESSGLTIKNEEGLFGIVNEVSGIIIVQYEYDSIIDLGNYYFYLDKGNDKKYIANIDMF